MDCREFLLRYSDYDDSLLAPHETARFRAHLAECTSCARYDRVLRKGRMVARQLPRIEPADDFIPRLQRRLLQSASSRTASLATPPAGTGLAAGLAAATIMMVLAAALMLASPVGGGPAVLEPEWLAQSAPGPAAGGAEAKPARRRVVTLPPVERFEPRAWEAREVAPSVPASYSPLETGPPAYRAASSSSIQQTTRRALD